MKDPKKIAHSPAVFIIMELRELEIVAMTATHVAFFTSRHPYHPLA